MKKLIALIKYLFFPILFAQSAEINFQQIVGSNKIITATAYTEKLCWIGTDKGLFLINNKSGKTLHLTTENSVLPSNHILSISVTSDENVYAATDNGIFRFDGFSFLVISNENSNLPASKITAMVADGNDNLWIGTKEDGLILMHNYQSKFFNSMNSILNCNKVIALTKDENGNIVALLANGNTVVITTQSMSMTKGIKSDSAELAKGN